MTLHYLTFMGRDLENRKKLTLVRMMNCVGMNSKHILNNVGISNDSTAVKNIFKD